jgi:HPt (histidine-containing phosphotransfer) domain-containing protein
VSAMPASADHGSGASVSELLNVIWNGHRERVQQRVETISAALDALARDELGPEQRAEAERAAHMIAGAGGTFGFARATELARELEHRLALKAEPRPPDAVRLVILLDGVRTELGRA